jgi:hypothetical protein
MLRMRQPNFRLRRLAWKPHGGASRTKGRLAIRKEPSALHWVLILALAEKPTTRDSLRGRVSSCIGIHTLSTRCSYAGRLVTFLVRPHFRFNLATTS